MLITYKWFDEPKIFEEPDEETAFKKVSAMNSLTEYSDVRLWREVDGA